MKRHQSSKYTPFGFWDIYLELGMINTVKPHRIDYVKERLQERGYNASQGRVGLPECMEGKVEPAADRITKYYLEMNQICQEEVGVLIWIASRTRPDIDGSVSIDVTLAI